MWQELVTCSSTYNVAFCLPIRLADGTFFPIYWYGILAACGIILGATYARYHMDLDGEDGEIVWDALIWALIAGLIGARIWYIVNSMLGGVTYDNILAIINPRQGGLHIFGGAIFGFAALAIYCRVTKVNFWLLADAAFMGLLIGQGIGRFGNLINIELYGPPTGSPTFGLLVPAARRVIDPINGQSLFPVSVYPVETTRFHLTMLYEAAWLFLIFGVLYYLFRRYQSRAIPGLITGAYLTLVGFGRFWFEFIRPDQPRLPLQGGGEVTYTQLVCIALVITGVVIVLDRLGHLRVPGIDRPLTIEQRERHFDKILRERRRQERAREKEALRAERRLQRERRSEELRAQSGPAPEQQEVATAPIEGTESGTAGVESGSSPEPETLAEGDEDKAT